MGTWAIGEDEISGEKVLIYFGRGVDYDNYENNEFVMKVPENDVAKLITFLQGCGESWKLEPREQECTASPTA